MESSRIFSTCPLLDGEFCAVGSEKESVGDNHACAAHLFQTIHDKYNKEIRRFAALHRRRKVQLGIRTGAATVWRVHADAIHLVAVLEFRHLAAQRIRMGDVRFFDVVDEHVGNRKQIRQRLPFLPDNCGLELFLVARRLYRGLQVIQATGQKTARAAGEVAKCFAEFRVKLLHDKVGQCTRGVEFARITSTLQVLQDSFVNVAESVAVFGIAKVHLINDVDELAEDDAVFHVLVQILENHLHDGLAAGRILVDGQVLQCREEFVVHEREQSFAGERLAVLFIDGPVAPTQFFGDNRFVLVLGAFPDFFLGVIDLQEKHPHHLFDTLCIAVDTGITTHFVLESLHQIIYRHSIPFETLFDEPTAVPFCPYTFKNLVLLQFC